MNAQFKPRISRTSSYQEFDQGFSLAEEEARLRAKIAALQAKQRRQRLMEDLDPPRKAPTAGFRFVHAFLIVLGLHLAAVGAFYGYSTIKKIRDSDHLALQPSKPTYAGVPDASPQPVTPTTAKISSSPVSASPVEQPKKVAKKTRATKQERTHTPSSEIRALFAKQHPTTALASTPSPLPPPPSEYTVGPGDTLNKVASMMGVPASQIRQANRLESGGDLRVGQKLTIPSPDAHPPLQLVDKDPDASSLTSQEPDQFVPKLERIAPNGFYTVQHGDNPYSIAHRLGVSFMELMTANSITNPADITVGMKLKVPGQHLASN